MIEPVKKSAVVCLLLCLTLSSCAWTLSAGAPFVGERLTVWVPDKVAIYKEPTLKNEPYYLKNREEVVLDAVICSDYRFTCMWDLLSSAGFEKAAFYKVKFKSGEYGYLKSLRYLVEAEKAAIMARREPALYKNADFDSIWNAALNTLEELDYVTETMSKEEGYITTEMRTQKNKDKDKVSIRLSHMNDSVMIEVASFRLYFKEVNKEAGSGFWYEKKADGYLEQRIKETIDSRLLLKRPE